MTPRPALVLVALLAAAAPLSAQPAPKPAPASPRTELEDLRAALEVAMGQRGRIRLAAPARNAGRVYRLKGYGAVIVLAPRALPPRRLVMKGGPQAPGRPSPAGPSEPRIVINIPEGTFDFGVIDLGDFEREMELQMAAQAAALREMETRQQEWSHAHEEEMREHLRIVEQQAEAFRLEAERARRRAERDVRTRLAPPTPIAAPEPPAPVVAPPVPLAPPVPPAPDSPFFSEEVPFPPEPPDAPPPWRFWFDITDGNEPGAPDGGDAEAIVTSVQERVVAGLESYRRPLASLRAEDFVTVAVDLVPDVLLRARPARTLLVRVRAGDLQDHRAGRLSSADFRKRVDFEEN